MPDNKPMGERVAHVEEWQVNHEMRCEERMSEIRGGIGELKTDIANGRKFINRTLIGILLALLAFLAKEVWTARGGVAAGVAITTMEARK